MDKISLDSLRPGERREILIIQEGEQVQIETVHYSYNPPADPVEVAAKKVKRFLGTVKIYPPGFYFRVVTEKGRKAVSYRMDKLKELVRQERINRRLG